MGAGSLAPHSMRPMQRHLLNFRMQDANAQIVDDLHSGGLAGDEEEEFTCSRFGANSSATPWTQDVWTTVTTLDSLAASAKPSCSCCSPVTCETERLRLPFSICTVTRSTEQSQELRLLLPDRKPIELSHLSEPELKALATFVGVDCVGAGNTALLNSLTDYIHVSRPQRWTLRDLPVSCP